MSKVRSLVFGGLICAIHIVALILAMYLPDLFIDIVIMFVMPFFMAMYTIKCGWKHSLIVSAATLLIGLIIDLAQLRALLLILPTLAVGVLYGILVNKKATSHTIVYSLFILEVGLFFMSAGLITLLTGLDFISNLKEIFRLHNNIDTTLFAVLLLVIYCFAQAFLLHFILMYQLKKMKVEFNKSKYPPFWLFFISLGTLIATFFNYKDPELYLLITALAIAFASSIAIYGYQCCSKKLTTMFVVQAAFFLVISVPIIATEIAKDNIAIPYIVAFLPPFLYGAYDLFIYTYPGSKKLKA